MNVNKDIYVDKAAEWLDLHRLELQERFVAQGIPLRLGPETIAEVQDEVAAIEAWNAEASKDMA